MTTTTTRRLTLTTHERYALTAQAIVGAVLAGWAIAAIAALAVTR